jgi:Uma2 family endonuclease
MEAIRKDIKFTYQQYRHLPEDRRYELIEGELYMTPSPQEAHQRFSGRLQFQLVKFIEEKNLGYIYNAPMDVYLSEFSVVQPDLMFISRDRKGIIKKEYIQGAPDLVIEILSPGTSSRDQITKKQLYGKYGVIEYWIVDPEAKTIEILTQGNTGLETLRVFNEKMILETTLLPAFTLQVACVFREL